MPTKEKKLAIKQPMSIGQLCERAYGPLPDEHLAHMKRVVGKRQAEAHEIKPNVVVRDRLVWMEFQKEIDFLLMSARGARKLAEKLVLAAEELEQGNSNG